MHYSGTEAVRAMNDMRESNLKEVRLLQRGLKRRTGDTIDDVADVLERLGMAVVSREELAKDCQKLKANGWLLQRVFPDHL